MFAFTAIDVKILNV